MIWAWALAGTVLGAMWSWRVIDAFAGMRNVPDLSMPEFDRVPADSSGNVPLLNIVVPARNEAAHIEATLRSLLAVDYPCYRIVAVDDRSTDGTGEILNELAATAGERLRVLHVTQLPPGWLGKTHAMWLAQNAVASGTANQSEWLLFTDADVIFRPDGLRRAVAYAEQSQADHLVLLPKVETRTTGGHVMVAFFTILFMFWHRPWKVDDPLASDYIGFGPFNLIRRRAYEAVGTWRTLRLAVVEDMKLGEAVKRHGFTQRVAVGQSLVRHFWANDANGVIDNLTKNFFAVARYDWWRALGSCVLLLLFHVAPFVGLLVAPGWAKLGFAATLGAIATVYIRMSQQPNVSAWYFLLHPIAALLFAYTMLRSMAFTWWRGGVVWRGTRYSLDELRQEFYGE